MHTLKTNTAAAAMKEAFPEVDPGIVPYGARVLVQIRSPRLRSSGGIILSDESKDTEKWNTQIAKVISLGPLAFKNRTTQESWPEGEWTKPGEFVRVPKYGGDRWEVSFGSREEDRALFVIFRDLDVIGKVTGDPLAIKAYA